MMEAKGFDRKLCFVPAAFVDVFLASFLFLIYIFYCIVSGDDALNTEFAFLVLVYLSSYFIFLGIRVLRKINRRFDFIACALIVWSGGFYLSSFKFLYLQNYWKTETAYVVLMLPLLCFIPTIFVGRVRTWLVPVWRRSVFFVSIISLTISYALLVYEFSVSGVIPLLSKSISQARLDFALPFFHVLSSALIKLAFVLLAFLYVDDKTKRFVFFLLLLCFFYYILIASRSGIIESLVFIMFLYASLRNKGLTKGLARRVMYVGLVVSLFSILGTLRQGDDFDISEYSSSKLNSQMISWFYSYYPVNMDNLAISIENDEPNREGKYSLLFLKQIVGGKDEVRNDYSYIGKLNLGTGFRDYTMDWGVVPGALVFTFVLFVVTFLSGRFKTELMYVNRSLILTYIALFPLVSRFSQFIPFFLTLFLYTFDFFIAHSKHRIKYSK